MARYTRYTHYSCYSCYSYESLSQACLQTVQDLLRRQLPVDQIEINPLACPHSPRNKENQQPHHDQRPHESKPLPWYDTELRLAQDYIGEPDHHDDREHRHDRQDRDTRYRNIGRRVLIQLGSTEWECNRRGAHRQNGHNTGQHA